MNKAEELRYLILAVQREGNRLLTEALAPLELTPAQAEVLQVLEQFEPMTLIELGERLVCESGSPSRLISNMVDKGLVKKSISKLDRRASQLSLTERARALLPALNQVEDLFNQRPYQFLDEDAITYAVKMLWQFAGDTDGGRALRRRLSK